MKEVQNKTKNKLYFGFSFVQFALLSVVFVGSYAFVQSQFLDPIQLKETGHTPYVIVFSIIPLSFLAVKLMSSIKYQIKDNELIITNYFIIPIKTVKINLSDIDTAAIVINKSEETPIIFEKKKHTKSKIFFVYGRKCIKLKPKQDNKGLPGIVLGTQNPEEWLKSFAEKSIKVLEESS